KNKEGKKGKYYLRELLSF
ncbi:unnamed protein product, partial [Litomosoides sigmodontis]